MPNPPPSSEFPSLVEAVEVEIVSKEAVVASDNTAVAFTRVNKGLGPKSSTVNDSQGLNAID